MKYRIEVATDIAMLGAWDSSRSKKTPIQKLRASDLITLRSDAQSGDLFLIELGGDWEGLLDIYVNSDLSETLKDNTFAVENEFLLSIPTGRLIVSGVEDYRSISRDNGSEERVVNIAPGRYGVRCWLRTKQSLEEEEASDLPSETQIREALGESDFQYYKKVSRLESMGCLPLVLFPILWYPLGWLKALLTTLFIMLPLSYGIHWQIKRMTQIPRYQSIAKRLSSLVLQSRENELPIVALQLRKLCQDEKLEGGRVVVQTELARTLTS